MPPSKHNRSAELHNLAEHTHAAAAADHLTPHELTKQADEHSKKTHDRDEVLAAEVAKRNKVWGVGVQLHYPPLLLICNLRPASKDAGMVRLRRHRAVRYCSEFVKDD